MFLKVQLSKLIKNIEFLKVRTLNFDRGLSFEIAKRWIGSQFRAHDDLQHTQTYGKPCVFEGPAQQSHQKHCVFEGPNAELR